MLGLLGRTSFTISSTPPHTVTAVCFLPRLKKRGGGGVAEPVERTTPGEEHPGTIPAVAARSLLVVLVSV